MSVKGISIDSSQGSYEYHLSPGVIKPHMVKTSADTYYTEFDQTRINAAGTGVLPVVVEGEENLYITVTVPKGATLSAISKQFGVDLAELQKLNGTESFILTGQSLKIPVKSTKPTSHEMDVYFSDLLKKDHFKDGLPQEITQGPSSLSSILPDLTISASISPESNTPSPSESLGSAELELKSPILDRSESLTLASTYDEDYLPDDVLIEGESSFDFGIAQLVMTDEITGSWENYSFTFVDQFVSTHLKDIGLDLQIGRFEPLAPSLEFGYGDFAQAEDYDLTPAGASFDVDLLSFEGVALSKEISENYSAMFALGRTVGTDNIIFGGSGMFGTNIGPLNLGLYGEIFGQSATASFHPSVGMSISGGPFSVTSEVRSIFTGSEFEYDVRFMGTAHIKGVDIFVSTTRNKPKGIGIGITGDGWSLTHQSGETLFSYEIAL